MKKFKTFAPLFPGFYNTIFEYNSESDDISFYNEEHGTDFDYEDFEWDNEDYEQRVSSAFVSRLETELKQYLDIKIEFEAVSSPKYYNFSNDSINIEVELELTELLKLVRSNMEEATAYFKDKYTSRDGFMSFHSNDIWDWLDKEYILEKPEHRIGALLEYVCQSKIGDEDIIYWADSEYWMGFSPKETDEQLTPGQ